jgi:hypothetical protein
MMAAVPRALRADEGPGGPEGRDGPGPLAGHPARREDVGHRQPRRRPAPGRGPGFGRGYPKG